MIQSNRIINNRILTTTPRYTMTAEQKALERRNRAPYPFLMNAKVDGTVCAQGSITNRYAGASGKYYVNSAGALVLAASGAPYVHHIWDGTAFSPVGVLWEMAVQNLFTQSEALGAGGLTPVRASAGSNADTAPDGTATADRLIEDSSLTTTHIANNAANTLTAASYVFGTFAKAGTRSKIELVANTVSKARGFDLSAGTTFATTIGGFSAPNDYGVVKLGSGWYYCWIAFTGTVAAHDVRVVLNNGTTTSYTGDGASYAILWGHQLHLGSGPGSYIKCAGTQATRTADTATISSAFIEAQKAAFQQSWYYTPNGAAGSNDRHIIDTRDGSNNGFAFYVDTAAKLTAAVNSATANLQSAALTWTPGTTYKLTIKAVGTTWTLYRDDVSVATGTLTALSTYSATAYLGSNNASAKQANGAVLEAWQEAA